MEQIRAPSIVGFFRCSGFDHLVRFVTNAPLNKYNQPFCVYQDGYRVVGGYMSAGITANWLPVESASNVVSPGLGKSEESELSACRNWLEAGLANLADTTPHVIDEQY